MVWSVLFALKNEHHFVKHTLTILKSFGYKFVRSSSFKNFLKLPVVILKRGCIGIFHIFICSITIFFYNNCSLSFAIQPCIIQIVFRFLLFLISFAFFLYPHFFFRYPPFIFYFLSLTSLNLFSPRLSFFTPSSFI